MSFEVISVSPSSKSTPISFSNPNPRTSPAGLSGSFNANNGGWSGTGRITVGNENRNIFVQGQASGGWSGRPSFGGMIGGQIRF